MTKEQEITSLSVMKDWATKKSIEVAQFVEAEFGIENFAKDLHINASVAKGRKRSWGGKTWRKQSGWKPFISLALYRRRFCNLFLEYAKIESHPIIGTVSGSTKKCVTALIVHEIAHAVDHTLNEKQISKFGSFLESAYPKSKSAPDFKGHEWLWQAIYSILREKFVNGLDEFDPKGYKPFVKKEKRKYAQKIEVQHAKTVWGEGYSRYYHKGELVAKGMSDPYGWEHKYEITFLGKYSGTLNIENGRSARKEILKVINET